MVDEWLTGPEGGGLPLEGWVVLTADDESATIVNVDGGYHVISAANGRNGWFWSGAGSGRPCRILTALPDGMSDVDWELDPVFPSPSPDDTEVHLLATESSCTSGSEIGDRLLGPQVVVTDDAVRITVAAVALTGAQNCPGNPSTAVTVTLDEPLGDRRLVEGRDIGRVTDFLSADPAG